MNTRRDFIKQSLALTTGVAIGFPRDSYALLSRTELMKSELTPFVIIDTDGVVTLVNTNPDMGQGSVQSIPTLIAEELEVDLAKVRIIYSNGDERYGLQVSGGSGSVVRAWEPMRKAGAAAREMLIKAAAQIWKTSPDNCQAEGGYVLNMLSRKKLNYGQLVSVASQFEVPQNPRLKSPAEFRIIGKNSKRLDVGDKVCGKAQYGIDTVVEGMVYACILHAPVLHSRVKSIDDKKARSVGGVLDVIKCERPMPHRSCDAVAVIASNYWSALQGRKVLDVAWEYPTAETDSDDYVQRLYAATKTNGPVHAETGAFDAAYQSSASKLEAVYESQFLAHAPLEPENALAHVKIDGSVEVWVPYQSPNWAKSEIAKFLQVPPGRVKVNITLLGGSFGRKSYSDFLLEACLLSRHLKKPVKLIWSREDDISQGPYRPAMLSQLQGITSDARIIGMHHHAVGETFRGQIDKKLDPGQPDPSLCGEISFDNSSYSFAHSKISHTRVTTDIPIMWWRSVWGSNFAWGQECFFDELAHQMHIDPLQARMDVLQNERHRNVLNALAVKSGYYDALPKDTARGIAIWKCFGSIGAACVVVMKGSTGVKIQRVTSVLDCGLFVNEDMVRAQMEGNVIMGLSSATGEQITFTNGRCNQNNFHQYPLMRIGDVPKIDSHIIAQGTSPGGVGEPGLPPVAPALGNALFNLTGQRIRKLPISLKEI